MPAPRPAPTPTRTAREGRGDGESIESLARRYEHRVPFFVRKVSHSLQLGSCWQDDLVSAGYWGLFRALQNLRAGAPERERSAYVSQRVVGAVLDEARRRLNSTRELMPIRPEEREEAWNLDLASGPRSPEEDADSRRRSARVLRALELLDPEQQRLLWGYMAGASIREIARQESIPLGTMRNRFARLARDLRARAPYLRRLLLDLEDPEPD